MPLGTIDTSTLVGLKAGADVYNANFVALNDTGVNGVDQVFTEANLNPNVFGGNGTFDYIAQGWVNDATTARFLLHTSGLSPATSVTVVGTFQVNLGGSAVSGGVGISAFNLTSPSNKACVVEVTGLSGLITGDTLQLFAVLATSKITVNI